ncbi:MAG: HD-GYP domain-containing protein [Actinobacteria bacterium]|nr:HD-GYP domain-containing protein [Actinomycetota bacterium]
MNPGEGGELEAMQQQLLLFAQDIQTIVASERTQREDAESALRELSQSYLTMVKTLALVCEMKDNYTRHHLDRTYQYAIALTRRVAPELAQDASVGYGYLLHDIGKVGIPDAILNKPGPLDEDEWRVMRTHPVIGLQLVQPIKFLGEAVQIVKSHHERWDGRGYPENKKGEEIYLPARIFSIIDTFDAMTSDRPYRKGLPVHVAMEEIERCGGTQFDPELASAFVKLCEDLKLADTEATALTTLR